MAKIAHTQNDVKKRRATFEERWKTFQANMYDEEQIRKAVYAPIKLNSLNIYFSKHRNPLFGFDNGVFSYTEEPFRQALVKAKADLSMFKMSERKDKNSHGCFITYKDVEMHIWRWSVEGSPFGSYTVIPARQLPAEASWKIEESRFFWLNLPRLLMDVALEYSIRNEEFKYHLQHLKVFNMNTMVFDESNITLSDNPDEWMPTIENYFQMMKRRYNDGIRFADLCKEHEEKQNPLVNNLFPGVKNDPRTPKEKFCELCKEMDVGVEFKIGDVVRLTEPSGERREAFFMVEGYVMYVEEFDYYNSTNKYFIYPNRQHPEYSFALSGIIGLHALVGFLKQLPAICRHIENYK